MLSAPGAGRLESLDVFRGLTIASMVLVNNPGHPDFIYAQLRHAQWHGWTFTDMVFPFFLWIAGVALTLSTARLPGRVCRRAAILFGIGLLLNGFPGYDLSTLRIPGVLQRIAVCYLIAGIIYLYSSWRGRLLWSLGFLAGYTALMHPGGYEMGANLAARVDAWLLPGHLWAATKTWDPEGVVSTLPAISTCLAGILTGDLLRTRLTAAEKTTWMLLAGNILIFAGLAADAFQPINKNIWTASYAVLMAGLALAVFGGCYWLVDGQGLWRGRWTRPLVIFGVNALAAYIFSGLFARILSLWTIGESPVKSALYELMAGILSPIHASLAYALFHVGVCFAFALLLFRRGWFLRF